MSNYKDKRSLTEITQDYFNNFSNKDIDKLSMMFDKDIYLHDWNQSVSGLQGVLDANIKIFESFEEIGIVIRNIIEKDNVAISEINVVTEKFRNPVVDVLTFNDSKKITCIRAYRGT